MLLPVIFETSCLEIIAHRADFRASNSKIVFLAYVDITPDVNIRQPNTNMVWADVVMIYGSESWASSGADKYTLDIPRS